MSKGKLTWKEHELAPGVHIEIADGTPTSQGVFEGRTYVNQRFGQAGLAVTLGPTEGLAAWKGRLRAPPILSAESPITICGQPGVRQEASLPGGPYLTTLKADDQSRPIEKDDDNPATTEIALTFPHGDSHLLAIWRVETAQRAAWASDEKHFFAAITCK
jgi:hypothetical protein